MKPTLFPFTINLDKCKLNNHFEFFDVLNWIDHRLPVYCIVYLSSKHSLSCKASLCIIVCFVHENRCNWHFNCSTHMHTYTPIFWLTVRFCCVICCFYAIILTFLVKLTPTLHCGYRKPRIIIVVLLHIICEQQKTTTTIQPETKQIKNQYTNSNKPLKPAIWIHIIDMSQYLCYRVNGICFLFIDLT